MINIMINDIRIYFRQDKKTYIYFIIKVLLFIIMFINIGSNLKKYSDNVFLLLFSAILFQGIYSINILSVSKHEIDNTKFLFTLPISTKLFILSKNSLAFIILFIEFLIIELIFILNGLLPIIHINKCLSFITAIIFAISISNILFKIDHKRDDINENSTIKSIQEGFKFLLTVSTFTILILFVVLNSYISFILKFVIAIAFYIFSFRILEKDIIHQTKFIEEIDLI
ncbi:hypothetical protein [Clostridium sp. Marseille-Q2269]|uniref:hypothetical protein n=1 Tax=Clostridium sp. Marseille-Q2269 TaxID=2942205 RepID=UPI002073709A|nr:hypothetical protein [Clostridium sp. Marseille-Q2269]